MRWILWACGISAPFSLYAAVCEPAFLKSLPPLEMARATLKGGTVHVNIRRRQITRVANALDRAGFAMPTPTVTGAPYPEADATFDQVFAYFLAFSSVHYLFRDHEAGHVFDDGDFIGPDLAAQRLTTKIDRLPLPDYLSALSVMGASRLFAAEHQIGALQRRVTHLMAAGRFLNERPAGDWRKWLRRFARGFDLAEFIARDVTGFADPYFTRTQLFVKLLNARFGRQLPKGLRDLEGLTISADDLRPMLLERMGILSYAEPLEAKIRRGDLIFTHSREEAEMRASTVVAGEELLRALRAKPRYRDLNVIALDAALAAQDFDNPRETARMPASVFKTSQLPRHRTVTTNY